VNQFDLMQQQMLDQFQQAISMLVQMFGTLHRDQMDTIREELDQLRDLTKEFHALKLELAARSQDRSPVVPAGPLTASGDLEAQGADPRVKERVESGTDAAANPVAARISPGSVPVSPILAPIGGSGASSSSQAPLNSSGPERLDTSPPRSQPQPRVGGLNVESDRDVLLWLHQRMMTLQQERETRWQRILKLLPGIS
jgi:hypothetical protein